MARPLTRWWSHHTDIIETLINAKKICCFTNSCVGWRRCRCFTGGTFAPALPIVGRLSDYRYLYLMRPPSFAFIGCPSSRSTRLPKAGPKQTERHRRRDRWRDGEININQPTNTTSILRYLHVVHPRGVNRWFFHQVPCLGGASSQSLSIVCQSSKLRVTSLPGKLEPAHLHLSPSDDSKWTRVGMFLASLN